MRHGREQGTREIYPRRADTVHSRLTHESTSSPTIDTKKEIVG